MRYSLKPFRTNSTNDGKLTIIATGLSKAVCWVAGNADGDVSVLIDCVFGDGRLVSRRTFTVKYALECCQCQQIEPMERFGITVQFPGR